MSFLVSDNDHSTTLGEVIAFIDTLEFDDSSALFTPDECEVVVRVDPSPLDKTTNDLSTTKRKRRKRHNLSSSTRLQQSKRAEILYLRKRAVELEDQVKKLQTTPHKRPRTFSQLESSTDKFSTKVKSMWEELAEAHYHARLQAEEKNRSLKALVASQRQASEVLCAILEKQLLFHELDLACTDSDEFIPKDDNIILGPELLLYSEPTISSLDYRVDAAIL